MRTRHILPLVLALVGLGFLFGPTASAQVEVVNLCPGSGLCLGSNSGQPLELWTDGTRKLRLQGTSMTMLNSLTSALSGTVSLNNGSATVVWLSQAAPTITSGFATSPTIAGRAYAFTVTMGSSSQGTTGTVALNATYTTAPVVVCRDNTTAAATVMAAPTTTTVVLTYASTVAADKIDCLAQGY